ncbi:hypothetical protein [Nocardioides sp.]|nr:hypothetical protein [Nocardioides sp.]HXH79531.1 hypothetical protein [Nocardioides sp.]
MSATAERTKREAEPMSDDLRDFLLVVRRALLMICAHIDRVCR